MLHLSLKKYFKKTTKLCILAKGLQQKASFLSFILEKYLQILTNAGSPDSFWEQKQGISKQYFDTGSSPVITNMKS